MTAVIWLSLTTWKKTAGVLPKYTPVLPSKLLPLMLTTMPPDMGPEVGDVPVGVVTGICTVAAAWVGATTVIEVGLLTVKDVAATEPKLTEVAALRLGPLMTKVVPPAAGPVARLRPLTLGAVAM